MLIYRSDKNYAEAFASVYNSANLLFPESERGMATAKLFAARMEENENIIEQSEGGEILAFLSYCQMGKHYELTALYVKREYQRKGLGRGLLQAFEEGLPKKGIVFVRVLKNARWAAAFYQKNGYIPMDEEMQKTACTLGIKEKPWSFVMCKNLLI